MKPLTHGQAVRLRGLRKDLLPVAIKLDEFARTMMDGCDHGEDQHADCPLCELEQRAADLVTLFANLQQRVDHHLLRGPKPLT